MGNGSENVCGVIQDWAVESKASNGCNPGDEVENPGYFGCFSR